MIGLHRITPPDAPVAHRRRANGEDGAVPPGASTLRAARRVRTIVLAGTLATGLLFPIFQTVQADTSPTPTPAPPQAVGATSTGLSISVDTVEQLTGLTAIVASGGENAHLRLEATADSESLAIVPDGTVVALRVDLVDTILDDSGVRWWPVSHDGAEGWISGDLLTQATTAEGDIVSSNLVAFDFTERATAHSTARVFGNGQNVNVRAEPVSTGEILTKAADGEVISLRIDMVDTVFDDQGTRWWPVAVDGMEGWISGFFLTDSEGATTTAADTVPAASATQTPTAAAATSSTFVAGDFVQVFTGDGSSVNIRASGSPDSEIVGQFADGEVVEVVSGPVSSESSVAGWFEVSNNNGIGFVDGDLLIGSVETVATSTQVPTEPPRSEVEEATIAATQQATRTPVVVVTEEDEAVEVPEAVGSGFIYPLENYRRTQAFGCSNLGFYSFNAEFGCPLHDGLDLAAPAGTPLVASAGGTVVTAGWCNCGLGYYVEIDHGDGIHTLYGHMASQPFVAAGQTVNQGDVIGPLGSTGISTGPHVHFMVTVNGEPQNPESYLP